LLKHPLYYHLFVVVVVVVVVVVSNLTRMVSLPSPSACFRLDFEFGFDSTHALPGPSDLSLSYYLIRWNPGNNVEGEGLRAANSNSQWLAISKKEKKKERKK